MPSISTPTTLPRWRTLGGRTRVAAARFGEDGDVVVEPAARSAEEGVVPDLLFLTVPKGTAEVALLEELGARPVSATPHEWPFP